MLQTLRNAWNTKDIRSKIIFTLFFRGKLIITGESLTLGAYRKNIINIRIRSFNYTSVIKLKSVTDYKVVLIGKNDADFFFHKITFSKLIHTCIFFL